MTPGRTFTALVQPGQKVLVQGWVDKVRDLGGLKFFVLRDKTGTLQITLKKGDVPDQLIGQIAGLSREDCVEVAGTVKAAKQAPGGKELIPDSIIILAKAETPLPIDIGGESGKDKRFDYRFLDLRDPKQTAVFRIKAAATNAIREFFARQCTEVHTPVIQAAGAEGGSTLFPLIYYNKEAFLRQSPQLYKQILMASGLDGIWEMGSTFRAEKFHTRRHISEILMLDFEMAWIRSEEDVMEILEQLIHDVYESVAKQCNDDLAVLDKQIAIPSIPFKRLTYDDVVALLNNNGQKMKWGGDLGDHEERLLGELLLKKGHAFYFITRYPAQIKPFYIMMDGKYSRGFDLDCKGLELASGGQREHRLAELTKIMKAKGLDPANFQFYLDAFRYGMPPHGGWAVGVDRLVMQMLDLPDVKESILFPRTPEKLVP